ncbi:MAG: Ig-like domain-containing protein [Casimicrobiaceae bacterium]
MINNLSQVHVGGGAPLGTADQTEVLLDIDTVMTIAPGSQVVVYDAPFSGAGSFQSIFNVMINDGVTIISNSFAYCENQTTSADVHSIDSILQTAAGAGITVVSASGDQGSTCLDGAPNTLHVPANVPHITAVGGTSAMYAPGHVYGSETWWNGAAGSPPTGQGGFGVSRFFESPSYQSGLNSNPMRSVPDVALDADPATVGTEICQASAGGCPTGFYYGGTSVAAPTLAAYAALLNQSQGSNLGFLNPLFYPLANTSAFHSPTSMGTDFAHVGLGSPNVNQLHLRLTNQTAGAPVAANSEITAYYAPESFPMLSGMPLPADGASQVYVTVHLADANGNLVGGKTVQLTGSPGNHATITPSTVISDANTGAAVFTVSDSAVESLTLTATDLTDNVVLTDTFNINVIVPPAAGGGISAAPTTVQNDGTSATTITVTLRDAQNNPSPGKTVTLAQGSGHSIITGPSPSVTDAAGTIQFNATDLVPETVTYTAVDVTDGDLPIPGSAVVSFSGQANASCVTTPPTAASGYALTAFSTGYPARNFTYSGINFGGCPGASNPAFDVAGNMYVGDSPDGKLYKIAPGGGAVSSGNVLANLGLTLSSPVFGSDGSLYVSRAASGSGASSGLVLQIDPSTGATIRTVASNLTCPGPLAVDPLSGDLFFTDICFGGGLNNPSLFRISNPNTASPSLSTYATLPGTPNGAVAIVPNGTIYVAVNYTSSDVIVQVSATNSSPPPTVTTLVGLNSIFWVTIGQVLPSGAAKSLIVLGASGLNLVDLTTDPLTATPLTNGQISSGTIGPDGCLYTSGSDTIYRLAPASGACVFSVTNPSPLLTLTPAVVVPNPPQGTSQTFTATFTNVSVPAGTPVTFLIVGPNARTLLATTNASGSATISYVGVRLGTDRVMASGDIDAQTLNSTVTPVTWVAGKHVSFLDLSTSPTSGISGAPVTLQATLSDASQYPLVPIVGVTIQFSIGGQTCSGSTGPTGVASCTLTPPGGQTTFIATFAGNAQFVAAIASQQFSVLAAPPPPAAGIVYVPLEPCRIMDTRNATLASGVRGPITGNVLYNLPGFIAAGSNWGQYGGTATADCGLANPPGGSIHAVALVATILNPNFDAFLGISDSNVLSTVLSNVALNYTHGQGLSTMYIVPQISTNNVYFAMPAGLSAQLIFDVVGYYVVADATALQCATQASAPSSIAGLGTGTATSPACSAGYTLSSGSCDTSSSSLNLSKHEATGGNSAWLCAATNHSGTAANLTATAICCRVPGK